MGTRKMGALYGETMVTGKTKRGFVDVLAVAMAAAVLGACAPTDTTVHDTGHLYSFAELEQHVAEHLDTAAPDVDQATAVAAAKAVALARLARAYMALQDRPGGVIAPSSLGGGGPACYTHHGKPAGACLDI